MATITGLRCPADCCDAETRVIDTTVRDQSVRRERICKNPDCLTVFVTVEDRMGTETVVADTHNDRGMPCPKCGGNTTVKQTRRAHGQVRRRRRCTDCHHTFKTKERPDR